MLDVKLLGERIKALRKEKGLTQGEFAKVLCVSFQAVSNWERGIAPPDLDNLMRIASHFGVLIDDLLKEPRGTLCLGIDGGGTKTEFVVVSDEGEVLLAFTKKGCNPNDITYDKTIALLKEGIREARLAFPSIGYVFCGISGIAVGDYRTRTLADLKMEFPSILFGVESDSSCLFMMDEQAEIAMISGTGSAVFIRNAQGVQRIGGWGYLFDTAGSAYDIGRDAVTMALTEEDEKKECSLVRNLLMKALGVDGMRDALALLYREGKPRIASLSTTVFEACRLGDATAYQIIDKTASRLATLLNVATETYGAKPYAIASGGVIENNQEIVLSLLKKYTDVYISVPDLPPVYGACRLALKLYGYEGEHFYDNFKRTYRRG